MCQRVLSCSRIVSLNCIWDWHVRESILWSMLSVRFIEKKTFDTKQTLTTGYLLFLPDRCIWGLHHLRNVQCLNAWILVSLDSTLLFLIFAGFNCLCVFLLFCCWSVTFSAFCSSRFECWMWQSCCICVTLAIHWRKEKTMCQFAACVSKDDGVKAFDVRRCSVKPALAAAWPDFQLRTGQGMFVYWYYGSSDVCRYS